MHTRGLSPAPAPRKRNGFTLVELAVIVTIIGILAAIAYPTFMGYLSQLRENQALEGIKQIDQAINAYYIEHGLYPNSLADVGMEGTLDAWGNPYVYLRIDGSTDPGLNGKRRRDKNMNPVNTDYDLYSKGPDGKSQAQFGGAKARDDLVRANNGRYYGVASEHIPL